ncbi:FIG00638519: hypothetical protein [Escherichia coli ISC41]|nr:FIG00638519: hypothetical protein [Escherichia coli ISC41]
MTIFNGLLEAKKGALKNGAIPALAIAIAAPNKKSCREHHHRQIVGSLP